MWQCRGATAVSFRSKPLVQKIGTTGQIDFAGVEDWKTAWTNYENGGADAAGIVDHVSFAVMRRLGLAKAFTNDRHFRAAGFENLF